jgi:hypothetical protein
MPSYQGDVFFRFRPIVICFVGIRLSRICGPSPTIRQSVAPGLERIKNWIVLERTCHWTDHCKVLFACCTEEDKL